jgi:hypothetical protein
MATGPAVRSESMAGVWSAGQRPAAGERTRGLPNPSGAFTRRRRPSPGPSRSAPVSPPRAAGDQLVDARVLTGVDSVEECADQFPRPPTAKRRALPFAANRNGRPGDGWKRRWNRGHRPNLHGKNGICGYPGRETTAGPRLFAGFLAELEGFERTSENRGVPGSSPGLAIQASPGSNRDRAHAVTAGALKKNPLVHAPA